MFTRLVLLISFFSFLCTSLLEVHDINMNQEHTKMSSLKRDLVGAQDVIHFEKNQFDDCSGDGCTDHEDCCHSLCSCTLSFFIVTKNSNIGFKSFNTSKIRWFFYNNYHSPLLDPALKPPLHS